MKTINLDEAEETLSRYARGDDQEPALVLVKGLPVAALVPLDELDAESFVLMRNPAFRAMLDEARRQVQESGGIPEEEVRRRLGLPAIDPDR
jgi:antitoxin (DNA-binding transcriptional repressor) of toxin-antitoxin stability system